ncbi:hypothetical protein E4U26_008176 [Claviceps purpurea]|nr:hypothetical protein E4U26_008176 [Claviceps purpurea]
MQSLMLSPIDTFQEISMDTHDEKKMRVVNVRVQARSDVPQSDEKYPAAVTQCGGFSPASTVMLNTMGLA